MYIVYRHRSNTILLPFGYLVAMVTLEQGCPSPALEDSPWRPPALENHETRVKHCTRLERKALCGHA